MANNPITDPFADMPPPNQAVQTADPFADMAPPAAQPQPDPLAEQRRRFEAMNPQGGLTSGGLMPPAATPVLPLVPQPVRDFGKLAVNEASMAAFPTLQAQAPAERERLGPLGSGVAETLGYYASPTTWFNAVPYVGGALAGGLHEGVKSKFEGDDWTTAAEKAGGGALVGGASTGLARGLVNPSVVSKGVDLAGAIGAGTLAHALFAQSPMAGYVAANMGREWVRPAVKWVGEESGALATALRPYVAAAIQGPASTVGPKQGWSRWWTGQ
jgi:hypothetical protein